MKEDSIIQFGDYDVPFCEQQCMHGCCYISLFKFKSYDQFNTAQNASNFRHLLSCGTIGSIYMEPDPFGTGTKLVQIRLVFTRELVDPLRIGSAIWCQMDPLMKVIS